MKKRSILSAVIAVILLSSTALLLVACNDDVAMNKLLKFDINSISEIRVSKDNITKITADRTKIATINEKILGLSLKKYDKKTYDSDWNAAAAYKVTYKQTESDGYFEILVIIRDVYDLENGVVSGTETLIGLRSVGDFDKKGSKEGFYAPKDSSAEEIIFDLFLNLL